MEEYRRISSRYAKLKRKPWKDFQSYFSYLSTKFPLPSSGILIDIGSGNGRNLELFKGQDFQMIASDLSFELLQNMITLPKNKTYITNNDMRFLPLKHNSAELVICIATIHHLNDETEVIKVLKELEGSLKQNGQIILSCWRRWKPETIIKMLFDLFLFPFRKMAQKSWRHGDIFVPWFNEKREVIARRYYHLFTKRELIKILNNSNLKIADLSVSGGKSGKDNFFVLLRKKSEFLNSLST
jgi:SAM-dependent methyltransferase